MRDFKLDHHKTPIFTFLKDFQKKNITPFFIPGHKYGQGLEEFTEYVGERVLNIDLTGFPETDNIANPMGIIREAQELFADAFGSDLAYLLVNGTSEGVQVMIRSAVKPGEKIIIPRNAHKSSVGGLIMSGAVPVYVQPEIEPHLGIATGVTNETIIEAFEKDPEIKGVLVVNPTYYGTVSDIKTIVEIAHEKGAIVLADEAHGAHMGFHERFPVTAMSVGADMSATSLHKTGGSMTQSSALFLQGDQVSPQVVKQHLNLTRTTSPSYVLMASLDVARKQLVLEGAERLSRLLELVDYAKGEINKIGGIYAFDRKMIGTHGIFNMDETKLGINVSSLGVTGYTVERELMTRFGVGFELGDLRNILGIMSLGDTKEMLDRAIEALKVIVAERGIHNTPKLADLPAIPELVVTPREAYYAEKKTVALDKSAGQISGEMLMAYPPGIPVVCPGERITQEVIDYVKVLKEQHVLLQGTADAYANYIRVL